MAGRWLQRWVALIVLVVLVVIAPPMQARAQGTEDFDALNKQVLTLYGQGKYAEAISVAKRSLTLAEKKFGPGHPTVGSAINNLAALYRAQGRYAEAEPLYKRSLAITEQALGPDHPDVGIALNNLAELYRAQGRYGDAEPRSKRALAITEKALGPDHVTVGTRLNNLASLYDAQGRYAEAEPLYKRALAIREKALGPDHPTVGTSLNNLAELYRTQGRYADAEPLFKRALAIAEKALGPDHVTVGTRLNNLAVLYDAQGRYAEAEPLFKRSLAISEKALGPDHPDIGQSLSNLAMLYRTQGRYAAAEPLFKRSLVIREKALGLDHPEIAQSLSNLAMLYQDQGRYAEAEPLFKRSLVIREKALGPDHPDMGETLNELAELYRAQGRYADAEPLLKRALAIVEKALGPYHNTVATDLHSLAELYRAQGRYAEAEPLYKHALAITEKALGPYHNTVAIHLNNLAELYRAQGRYAEAEPLLKRALAITEKALGPERPDFGTNLINLANVYQEQGRYAEAEALYKRALAISEKALGPDHPTVGTDLNNLAALYFVQRDWSRAAAFWRKSTSVIERRARRGTLTVGQPLSGKGKSEASQLDFEFFGLAKSAYRLAAEGRNPSKQQAAEMFEAAQWAHASEAAASLAQMAVRGAKGDPRLADIVRERQDLVAEWQKRDGVQTAAMSQASDKRDRQAEATNVGRLTAIDARIGQLDEQLKADFADYAALSRPEPLSVEQVQSVLRPDEALVLFLNTPKWDPTPEETFIWVVTKSDSRWVRSELGTRSLQGEVAALRCGLDYDGTWVALGTRCQELLKTTYTEADHQIGKPLPFDRERAHALYKALFGQVEDVIKDKQLLIVPSGALTQLPFLILITDKLDTTARGDDTYRRVAWLVRRNALTVLPSVSSLKALRELAKDSHADRAMIGFGNPLLDGPDARYAKWAAAARSKQSCPATPEQRVAALIGERRGVLPLDLRSGIADVTQIRMQVPLPETADELCAVARDLHVSSDVIRLGARATEAEVKRLSEAGELAKYRIIHFATHGALAGQVNGNTEPGLLLTPPDKATEGDDGYLSASEIATLKLDADWVILSACNTAAGGVEGAEALSGLARAFFYAGARALLVSHWAVYSDATVKLITGAVGRMAADKGVGRAEAMRQSMLGLIDKGKANEAHPSYWAPFVVVGEGAAAR